MCVILDGYGSSRVVWINFKRILPQELVFTDVRCSLAERAARVSFGYGDSDRPRRSIRFGTAYRELVSDTVIVTHRAARYGSGPHTES